MKDYFVQYCWQSGNFMKRVDELRFYASGPVIALNLFHRAMQRQRVLASDNKTVIRPKLREDEYTILRLFNRYHDAGGSVVESDFDLPDTSNPDARIHKTQKPVQPLLFPEEET